MHIPELTQHIPAAMMKGKTMAVAACVSVCFLAAEVVFVPIAMNSSYERYETFQPPAMVPVEDVQTPSVKERSRLVPLTPIRKHQVPDDDDGKPVS